MTIATKTITAAQAEGFYAKVMDKIRERHDPPRDSAQRPEPWDAAVAHVVMGMGAWDAQVVWLYLRHQPALAVVDKLLAEALAKRLGYVIEWRRTVLA